MPSWRGSGRGHRSHRSGSFDQPGTTYQLVIARPGQGDLVEPAADRAAANSRARRLSADGVRVDVQKSTGWQPFKTVRTLDPAPKETP